MKRQEIIAKIKTLINIYEGSYAYKASEKEYICNKRLQNIKETINRIVDFPQEDCEFLNDCGILLFKETIWTRYKSHAKPTNSYNNINFISRDSLTLKGPKAFKDHFYSLIIDKEAKDFLNVTRFNECMAFMRENNFSYNIESEKDLGIFMKYIKEIKLNNHLVKKLLLTDSLVNICENLIKDPRIKDREVKDIVKHEKVSFSRAIRYKKDLKNLNITYYNKEIHLIKNDVFKLGKAMEVFKLLQTIQEEYCNINPIYENYSKNKGKFLFKGKSILFKKDFEDIEQFLIHLSQKLDKLEDFEDMVSKNTDLEKCMKEKGFEFLDSTGLIKKVAKGNGWCVSQAYYLNKCKNGSLFLFFNKELKQLVGFNNNLEIVDNKNKDNSSPTIKNDEILYYIKELILRKHGY